MKKLSKSYQLGHYRLLNTLASKDHLEVYEGVHLDLGRRAAIKALYLNEIKEKRERQRVAERFQQEARRLEDLRGHPNIVELYEYGEEAGVAFMVMQFAPSGSLAELHPLGDLLSFAQIRRYAREIGGALQVLHDQGWLHRDVKPGNIFVGARKQTLLGDFELVIEDHSRQETRGFLEYGGTKVYMAPEQAKGEPCPASDQYALATMLFEWLTGFRPFNGTPEEIVWQRQNYPAPSLRELAPDVPLTVEQVILRGLQISPYHRYASMRKFVQALEYAFDPPVRHPVHNGLYHYKASHSSRPPVARRHGTQPRQRAITRPQVAEHMPGRASNRFEGGHSSEALRRVQKEAIREPQFNDFTLQPQPISIHEDAFEVEEGDFELYTLDPR